MKCTILLLFICVVYLPIFCLEALGQRPVNQTGSVMPYLDGEESIAGRSSVRLGQLYSDDLDGWLRLFLQIVGGGLLAGLAILVSNVALDHHRKPNLIVLMNTEPTIPIDLSVFEWDHPFYRGLQNFAIRYRVQRVAVWNNSDYAAEDCKAVLRQDGSEDKICWMIPQERYKMTINAHATEYIDVVGALEKRPDEVFSELQDIISQIEVRAASTNNAPDERPGKELAAKLKQDYLSVDYIPRLISPTEHGWEDKNVKASRPRTAGNAQLVINSKNGKSEVVVPIVVLDGLDENGRIITF